MRASLRSTARGFALTDLLVALVALGLLLSFAVPAQLAATEMRNRIKCASNLRMIGQCLTLYANENGHIYPRTGYSEAEAAKPDLTNLGVNCSDPFDSNNPFDPKGVGANNVTSAIYLVIRAENLKPSAFVCPSSDAQAMSLEDSGPLLHSNFDQVPGSGKSGNLSYSVENPYAGKDAVADGWKWNDTLASDVAVAADLNPGKGGGQDPTPLTTDSSAKQMQAGNSLNHATIGQNVLFGDGHVEFLFQPMCGVNRDCIYTTGGVRNSQGLCAPNSATIVGPPASRDDSILLPTQY